MMKPTIHMNGTSKGRLLDGYTEAALAIRHAMDKLAETAPNGRDYYPQGPDAIGKATNEHSERMAKLRSLLADMSALAVHVCDG